MKNKIDFKKRLMEHCVAVIQQRVNGSLLSMQNAQSAANSEEKSSAGDKYETSRAMSHLEKDMHARQLAANQHELAALRGVDCSTLHIAVTTGSLVVCKECMFFIAAGLGKIFFEGETVYVIAPTAPVAAALLHKVAGDSLSFNNKIIYISGVF